MSENSNITQSTFANAYLQLLQNLGYESKAMVNQLSTTFAYEPIDKLSDEIESLDVTTKVLTKPIEYLNERLEAKKDMRDELNKSLNERFLHYLRWRLVKKKVELFI